MSSDDAMAPGAGTASGMRCVTAAPGAGATVRRDGLWCENSGMLVLGAFMVR